MGGRITLRMEKCGNGRIGNGVQDEGIGLGLSIAK